MRARQGRSPRAHRAAVSAMDSVLASGGELGRLIAATDWSATPLGPISGWRQSLRSAVDICLSSRFPIVMYWGRELTVVYNDAYSEILGAKHPWALGKPCDVCWAEIWDTIGPMLHEVVATGKATWSDDLELELERHGAPEECYFSFSFSPVHVEDGSVGGVFTAVVETTSRVLNDRRLRVLTRLGEHAVGAHSAEEAARRCVDAMSGTRALPFALIYLHDDHGEARLVASTGLAAESMAKVPPWPFAEVDEGGRPVAVELAGTALRPQISWAHDLAPRRAIVSALGTGETGNPAGYLVTATNPLRPLDGDYQAFFDLVARQVTGAIGHARAYESERRRAEALAELDRAKTEFFSNVSHEFRTPLTLMLGPLESLIGDADAGSRSRQELEMVQRNALRLLKLVSTLLDFARIESRRGELVLSPVDLATATADLAAVFRSAAEHAGLRLVVDCPTLPEHVHIDAEMWEKVVLNLLSNALKYTLSGEIRVRLRDVDGMAELTVSDTGSGIAEDELPRIFDRFYRARNVESRTHEGAGIGLSLVKELVEMMEGRIDVASRAGEGTTFKVRVPYGPADAPSARPAKEVENFPGPGSARTAYAAEAMGWVDDRGAVETRERGVGGKILVVDDNADMRAYLTSILQESWDVESVADGAAALDALKRNVPDIVLTDVMMPRLGGFDLLAAIRGDPQTRELPVVVLSARAGEDSIDGLAQGADDYLVKPFSERELQARLHANVSLARMRRELARSYAELELAAERASFLNMAAHELRTPLTVIGGYVDLILSGVIKPGGAEATMALEKVAHKTKEGVRLVEQMLTAARMESGAISVNLQTADLRSLAVDAAARARSLAELEAIDVRASVPAVPVIGLVDPALVNLILDNLVVNAIFHGAGPIEVQVLASPPRVRVVDSGPGVADGARQRIFEPFYQVEGQLKARGGAGLGLAVSRRLAEMHGGSLTLEESLQGASFLLTLPAPQQDAPAIVSEAV